ncbi:hypothetical protein ER308_03420 [Egibacter rhizosphaerae]|uniref:Uncharacterized protein n=1 Tax=Egibacter rhizosphaerae TaxID=1670831 RepID=A0A411YBZ2_9ACTN|nr:hypothetical protein [Egibacter rhizosphaerae]QBI18698.1 hypothetical protein ER308_03420 [Egibacter rhizosphaerae]
MGDTASAGPQFDAVREALDAGDPARAAEALLGRAREAGAPEQAEWAEVVDSLGRELNDAKGEARKAASRAERALEETRRRHDAAGGRASARGSGGGSGSARTRSAGSRETEAVGGVDDPAARALRNLADRLLEAADARERGDLEIDDVRKRLREGFHEARRELSEARARTRPGR